VVLPILREQQAGSGKDEEHLVPNRTRALQVQPDTTKNFDGMPDDQGVGHGRCHQEETWVVLEASTQEG